MLKVIESELTCKCIDFVGWKKNKQDNEQKINKKRMNKEIKKR